MDYITVDELRAYVTPGMEFVASGTASDSLRYSWAITAASRAVDHATGRTFGQSDTFETRYFSPYKDKATRRWAVKIDDLVTTSGMSIASDYADTWTYDQPITNYRLWNDTTQADFPYTRIGFAWAENISNYPDSVAITAKWGWPVPDTIKQATAIQAHRFIKRQESPFGIAGAAVEGGQDIRLLAKLDPDVAVMISSYTRAW